VALATHKDVKWLPVGAAHFGERLRRLGRLAPGRPHHHAPVGGGEPVPVPRRVILGSVRTHAVSMQQRKRCASNLPLAAPSSIPYNPAHVCHCHPRGRPASDCI
jgi:hypothetical protein